MAELPTTSGVSTPARPAPAMGVVGLGLIGGSFARAYRAASWTVYALDPDEDTFDLNAVPTLHYLSHLPVVADPSHATGYTRYVEPMALAACAAGADALEIEVHDDPSHAWSDGAQALTPDMFDQTMERIRAIRAVVAQDAE